MSICPVNQLCIQIGINTMHGAKWKLKASEKPFKVVAEGATKCDDSTDL